ncbi:RNA polymerase sigma factor [Phocaeicola paurosaccharolyticus]|uniref:RNA polymerase sigma factor n=1 Tax=Phocaeicola paurosaccharolyticus TaxID=732242 RepID=UPI000469D5E4|nr:sigma-70 family RNA polymerase sigma factor [Phocaeicola paurosaccharolyticus]
MEASEAYFSKIIKENKSTIFTVCYMFSNDKEEVNDLFQNILINIWQGLSKFEGRSNMKTWIYRISLNSCISSSRKKKRDDTIPLSMDIDLFDKSNDESNKQIELLHKRISKLQPFDRAIVLLWLENMPYEEIGQIIGISTRNVTVRMFRIREQLKNMSIE